MPLPPGKEDGGTDYFQLICLCVTALCYSAVFVTRMNIEQCNKLKFLLKLKKKKKKRTKRRGSRCI
jgi:hypothetical protein